MNRVVAIDGPSGAGKSTVARALARLLGHLYVDSGALYRIVTWQALVRGIDTADAAAVATGTADVVVDFDAANGAVVYRVGGVVPNDELRTPEINRHVSPVSKVAEVRTRVTAWLRAMRALGPLVVEGRDIGSVVFPDTPARFYIDASADERARRRHLEEQGKGIHQSRDAVLASLLNRDRIDSSRELAPLRVADGAYTIDTTNLPIDDVVAAILARLPPDWLPPSR